MRSILILIVTLVLAAPTAAAARVGPPATDTASTVSQTWQMLDYLATDYAGAVRDGAVLSASEYAEMREFAATVRQRLEQLPPVPASPALRRDADALATAIADKASPAAVAAQAHALADALLASYPVPTAPAQAPDLARGRTLYRQTCAACHGARGQGDGPAAARLDPPPIAFTDAARADQRSALSLYEVISQGVPGTAMAGYGDRLSGADRWALAFYVGSLAYADQASGGADAWRASPAARARLASLEDLARVRVSELTPAVATSQARAIVGYLRAHPRQLEQAPAGLALARQRLDASLAAYRHGDRREAQRLALSAYLDGVEPVEPQLDARDHELRSRLESAMGAYRSRVAGGEPPASVEAQAAVAGQWLARAQEALAGGAGSAVSTFLGAFTILVREGLEALLVVVALLAFLRKAERPELVRHVHAGWGLALLAGLVTWAVASYAVTISGAGRELTEGLSSLFAAAVLLGVGLWMHSKSIGGRWQAYLKARMTAVLDRRSAWFLFGLAFISVYREVFETILFYVAMWSEGQPLALLAGVVAGAAALGAIAWALLRTSRRLPLGTFFSASSALIALLAVVLTGKGVAALQEAGWIGVRVAPMPHLELLGIYPTWQSLSAQLLVVLLLAAGFAVNRQRARVGA